MEKLDQAAKQVMIAEDDDDDFMVFSVAIKETSYKVLIIRAEDGNLLLKLLEENIPDILFLDLNMPCKDGKECLKVIRASRRYDSLPIIIYSSLSDLTSIEYCFREGSNLYMVKPTDYGELKTALERILTVNWSKTLYFPQRENYVVTRG